MTNKKVPWIPIRKGSLAVKYSVIFLVGLLTVFLVAFIYAYNFSSKILLEEGEKNAATLTDLTITRIENVLQPIQIVPATLVKALETPGVNENEILRLSRDFTIENPEVFGTCLAYEPYQRRKDQYWYAPYTYETSYGIRFKVLGNKDYDYFSQDWYRLPELLNQPVWTEPYFDKGGGDALMCTYSVPFYKTEKGKRIFKGVLTVDISLSSFKRIVNSVKVFKSGYAFLVSQKGSIINYPDLETIHGNIREIVKKGKGTNTVKAVEEMLQGKRGFVRIDGLRAKKDPSFLYYAPVSSTGWSLGIVFPEKELFSDFMSFFQQLIIIFLVCVFFILLTTVLITRRLTLPISRLVDATRRIGQGDLNASLPVYRSKDEISHLTNAFSLMQKELATYLQNLRETTIAKEKIESELTIAHTIQMGMLPTGFPVRKECDLFAMLESAKAVGGDLYDFFFLDDHHLCIAIGDVAGKGVPASLFMAITRTLVRSNISLSVSLPEAIGRINQTLSKENPNQMFVTFWIGIIDLQSGEMEYCNAGHNFPFLIEKDGIVGKISHSDGLPLGVFEGSPFTTGKRCLNPGEILILYTDGITEALNEAQEFYGEKKLIRILSDSGKKTAKEIGIQLSGEIHTFSQGIEPADDITILVFVYKGNEEEKSHPMNHIKITLVNQLSELDKIVDTVEKLSDRWGLSPKVSMELNLVLEELFTNVVFYAFDDGEKHDLWIEFDKPDERIMTIRMIDEGKPFNLLESKTIGFDTPLEDRKIGGLGIHFVKEMMDRVEYERHDNKNVVILTKKF